MSLWVPPRVSRELVNNRLQYQAELSNQAQVLEAAKEWNPILQRIDPDLELIFAPESADLPNLTPGRWHVMRRSDLSPPQLIVLETPDGHFMEPGSYMLDLIERADLWSDRVLTERKRAQRELETAAQRQREREREDRRRDLRERLDSKDRTSVLF